MANGTQLDAEQIEATTGVPLAAWQDLMARMKHARFGAIFFGRGLSQTRGRYLNTEALWSLVRDMNAHTRFVAMPLRAGGNVTGADNVVCWQTGYPFAVNLSRGYPRYNPGEYTAVELLSRGEVDAAMIVTGDPMQLVRRRGPHASGRHPNDHHPRKAKRHDVAGRHGRLRRGHPRHPHARHGVPHGRHPHSAATGANRH